MERRTSGGAGSEADGLPNFLNVLLEWFECDRRTAQAQNYQRGGCDPKGVPYSTSRCLEGVLECDCWTDETKMSVCRR